MLHLVSCLYYLYQWCTAKQISDNEIYLLIKYIKSVSWRVAKRLSYIQDARCLKVNIYCNQQQISTHPLSNTLAKISNKLDALYIKSVPWRVAKHLSCIKDARCLKVNIYCNQHTSSFKYTRKHL